MEKRSASSVCGPIWRAASISGIILTSTLNAEDLVRFAASSDPKEKQQLIDLYHLFSLDFDYRPVDLGSLPYAELAISTLRVENGYLIHNYGVLQCLEGLFGYLRHGGMIL